MLTAAYQRTADAYSRREYLKVVSILKPALMKAPRFADGHHLLGLAYDLQNKHSDAEKSIKAALVVREAAQYYFNLGLVQAALENHDGAVATYRNALRMNPNDAKAASNLGNI